MLDKLRTVGCPAENIDQIGGWSLNSIGQNYGEGFSVSDLVDWLKKIVCIRRIFSKNFGWTGCFCSCTVDRNSYVRNEN